MTSEPHGSAGQPASREATDDPWAGDVHDGVAAWVRRSAPATERERPARSGRSTGARGGGRSRRRSGPPPEDRAAQPPAADPEQVARTILLDQLTGRARSRQELSDKLRSKQVPDDVAAPLLDRFEEVGLVDDAAFARSWVSGRQQGKGLARRALAQELRRKGVEDEVAREALDEIDPDEETEVARRLVRKKLRTLSRVDDTTATRRLVGMLARKGFPAGTAYAAVREELASSGRDEPDGLDGADPW